MREDLKKEVSQKLETSVSTIRRLPGGDINEAFGARLSDGREIFIKTCKKPKSNMYRVEAAGLDWLRVGPLRIPQVLAAGETFLALEMIEPAQRSPTFDEELGRGLAMLHLAHPSTFGWDESNYIGSLPQSNRKTETWAQFYREERLFPQFQMAMKRGIPRPIATKFEILFSRLDDLIGDDEPPARLHGDLWNGNVHVDEHGAPCLIDPAVYGGHREMDLAMMRLFGGFRARVFAAYHEVYPIAEDHEERIPLYQLYPLLVHVNLFGGGYFDSLQRALDRFC